MKRYILLFLTSFIAIAAAAQNRGIVKAVVLDSINKQPIGFATVAVLKVSDSSLVSYTITDKNGAFTLHNLNTTEPSRLLISCVGHESLHIGLHFKKDQPINDLGQVFLTQKTLKEVTITADRVPVIIKKDTIEFNAEAFKVRPNAVVEDLLKKLPGVQVDNNGAITVNGKSISKIKVDGKDFFANDPTIATRNLDADMISKVQVYDDRENDPDHLVPEYNVKKIINLKFKKAFKKSVIGNTEAATGTQDRYEAGGFLSKFQDDFQLSASVNSDNLSGTKLFIQDGHLPASFGGSGGTTEANRANVNFNDKIGKNIKLNIEYELNDRLSATQQNSQQQQFIGDTIFNTNSASNRHNHEHDQGLHIKTDWTPDTVTTIKFYPDLTYSYNGNNSSGNSTASTNFDPLLNQNITTDHSNDHSLQYQHTLSYYRRLNKKGASFNISNTVNIRPDRSIDYNFNNLISYSAALPSDTLSRSSKNTNTDYTGNLSIGYHDPLTKKLSLDVAVIGYHDRNEGDLLTYDEDFKTGLFTIFNAEQSSDLVRYEWQQTVNPDLTYNFTDKISLKAGFLGQLQQIDNHFSSTVNDLNQHFAYLLPSAELHINNINLNYSENIRQPGINQLQPITITYSPLYTFIGNPDLKPTRLHTAGLNFNHYYQESQMFIGFFGQTTIETNTILSERTVNAEGATTTTPINRNGRFTTGLNGNLSKSFKKQGDWIFSIQSNANFITGHNFFEVNGQDGYQNTTAIVFSQQISANWKDVVEVKPFYSINSAITKYQLVDYKPSSYTSQTAGLTADLFLPKKYVWSVDYGYKYNPLLAPGFQRSANILSLSVAKHVQKKDKGEFRFTCYDILNQGVSSFHYASENTINDSQTLLLRRYFLLSYSYRFTSMTK
jgi:Outer membrane protein beta-barrel family